ncbi:hypothetical protein nbrc107696_22760 [Gordonia spumicola]|uniref:Uncharacterized protein n=1 Tax=Gordonia spumicola TaxID=589161 RepID=A0A7I9V9T8_9ACTN|nr:hypothetical protein [Gordonia spumicola]GEE01830.1 hypothetical protein nbrc107696_22760 [Gordonia spumicola]
MSTVSASRMRGGVVGATSAVTAIAAHAAAQGTLPTTSTLMVVTAAAAAIGAAIAAAPRLPGLPALLAGQGIVHLLLAVLAGHQHDMFRPSMAVSHGVGTLAALALIAALDALVRVVRRVIVPMRSRTITREPVIPAPRHHRVRRSRLVILGSVGLRGPPVSA